MGPLQSPLGPFRQVLLLAQTSSHATGHNRTNNRFFELVETLLQIHSCFFSHSINVRDLPISAVISSLHYQTRGLRSTLGHNEDGARGAQFPGRRITMGRKSLRGAPKSPSNVTNTFFSRVLLLPKDISFEHGSAKHFLPQAPSNIIRPLVQQSHASKTPATGNTKRTLEDLLPCYCYAIKTSSRTIPSQLTQFAYGGKGAEMSELQAHHCTIQ